MTLSVNATTPRNSVELNVKESKNGNVGASLTGARLQNVQSDTLEIKKSSSPSQKSAYKDPLLCWPLRGLAFTNDIGAAVMDIAPSLGMGLWVPALMYFGADIYDKYKSDEKEYEPSGKRAFKQAVFQACASVVLPIVVVHNGQKAASLLGRNSKNGMSLQLQEEVDKFTVDLLKRRRLKDYENDKEGFKKEFNKHLQNHLQDTENSRKTKNPFKILGRWIFGSKHGEKITEDKLQKVVKYSNKNIDEMFEIRDDLLNNKQPKKLSKKLMKLYEETRSNFSKDTNTIEGHVEDAIKATLKRRQRDKLFNTKLGKTLGGFVALGVSIKFIDHFVEKYVIEKLVAPGLDNIEVNENGVQFGSKRK